MSLLISRITYSVCYSKSRPRNRSLTYREKNCHRGAPCGEAINLEDVKEFRGTENVAIEMTRLFSWPPGVLKFMRDNSLRSR
jgi:hypothetical protein